MTFKAFLFLGFLRICLGKLQIINEINLEIITNTLQYEIKTAQNFRNKVFHLFEIHLRHSEVQHKSGAVQLVKYRRCELHQKYI